MSRQRKRRHARRRNPVPNPNMTDMLLLAGVVGVAGLGIWYLYSQNAALTPAQQGAATAQMTATQNAQAAAAKAAALQAS